tara:strand:+ start:1515 stop:1880 length:366 start_codon:yes stop_codon:yes gene_type:complete
MVAKSLKSKIKEVGQVDAGWAIFNIVFVKTLKSGSDECLGLVDFDKFELHIDDSISEKSLLPTLIHEIFHILFSTVGVRAVNEDTEEEIKITNEFIVEQATRGLLLLKRLNPELCEILYDT